MIKEKMLDHEYFAKCRRDKLLYIKIKGKSLEADTPGYGFTDPLIEAFDAEVDRYLKPLINRKDCVPSSRYSNYVCGGGYIGIHGLPKHELEKIAEKLQCIYKDIMEFAGDFQFLICPR